VFCGQVREKENVSERVWMKSAIVEREVGDVAEERRLLAEGLDKFPTAWKVSYFLLFPYGQLY